jgi:fused signal recognition particle receptor
MNIFSRLKEGLSKTRTQIGSILGISSELNDEFYAILEDALISADVGIDFTTDIINRLKKEIGQNKITLANDAYELLKKMLVQSLALSGPSPDFGSKPWVILVVGVNGVGKTTTIGKLAHEFRAQGKSVLLGAVDTFRAGAIEQLRIWSERTQSQFVSQHEGADPASVAFDAVEAAKARNCDILMLDTAGRLHNKVNLMNELEKIVRVVKRNTPHAPNEILLVIDATSGQNALKQAQVFNEIIGLTGLIISKLDGTAKGGIALSLTKNLGIPIRKIGVGEGISDLQDFSAQAYIEAMFGSLKDMQNNG